MIPLRNSSVALSRTELKYKARVGAKRGSGYSYMCKFPNLNYDSDI